ncbi:glycosyl hydrolase [Microdochium bolleyi]|uniref:Glycosyl hydrolase n=1 Tax=Microdochium bolleyi TaxID=196109 RepID=A0A136IZ93_9PEZI|nr:glycosyl hydrolase [Microdochium bolleyi]
MSATTTLTTTAARPASTPASSRQRLVPASQPAPHPLPKYHLKAPHGWINDPCAPAYDATTGTYHLYYQWNSTSCDWGDITWGQFTSRDGLHWSHGLPSQPHSKPVAPIIDRDQTYDKDGIFTGCLHPTGPRGEHDQLTVFYTSVCHLPLHWTLDHTRDSEGLSMATSSDGGRTWTKHPGNPIIKGEPGDVAVTGFRDPFLAEWPAMDKIRGIQQSPTKTLYALISGGIKNQRPTAFLYAVPADNLTKWTYLGPLVNNMPMRFSAASPDPTSSLTTWSGNFGANWECVNFMTLESSRDTQQTRDFLVLGAEGGLKPGAKETDESPYGQWSLWMAGTLRRNDDTSSPAVVDMKHDYSGYLDHGCFYAANSYQHPTTKQRIVWGWLKEEDLTLARREAKGWTGYLSLPRELYLQMTDNVVGVVGADKLEDVTSIAVTSARRAETLGIRPLPSLQAYRNPSTTYTRTRRSSSASAKSSTKMLATGSSSWELEATIRIPLATAQRPKRVGFHIRHNKDLTQRSTVYFAPADGRIHIDRSLSNGDEDIAKSDASGPFALFITSSVNGKESEVENLHLRIFSDGDVLEVFANDRFALSTMVYSGSGCDGISTFVESGQNNDLFESVQVWTGLGEARGIHDTATEPASLPVGRSAL